MPVCPWCNAAVESVNGPCPRCGKAPLDHPSLRGQGARAAGGPALGAAVPELDIPQRVSKPQPAPRAAAPVAAPAAAPAPVVAVKAAPKVVAGIATDHGNRFEDDDDEAGLNLDLDLSKGPPMVSASVGKIPVAGGAAAGSAGGVTASTPIRQSNAGGQPAASPAAPRAAPGAAPGAEGDKPRAALEPEKPVLDPYEVRALADYGDVPEQVWRTPLYAYRVLKRRPELKKLANIKRREAERTRASADDALVAFAELVRPTAEKLGGFARAFDDVRSAEQVQRERDAVLAAEQDTHKQRQAQHDVKITELEAQLRQIQAEERQIAQELGEQDTLLKRAEARMKRVDIEIRNALVEAGMNPDGPGDAKGT